MGAALYQWNNEKPEALFAVESSIGQTRKRMQSKRPSEDLNLFQSLIQFVKNTYMQFKLSWNVYIKLRWLGLRNWIIDNSDSKPSNFEHRYRSDSKSDNKIVLSIAISINFYLFLIKFNNFWSLFWFNLITF